MATNDWNENEPTDTTFANRIDDYNRQLRVDIRERLEVEHDFSTTDTGSTDLGTIGMHKQVTLKAPIAPLSIPTLSADQGMLYTKDVDTKAELHFRDEVNNDIQLTSAGYFNGAAMKPASIPSGSYAAGSINAGSYAAGSIDIDDIAAATIVTEAEGVGSVDNDTAFPTDGAVKDYVDTSADAMHDIEGGYNNCDVNGVKTKVYTKYLIGTLATPQTTTTIPHNITGGLTNILAVTASCYDDHTDWLRYSASDFHDNDDWYHRWRLTYNDTNVIIDQVGSYLLGNGYKIKIDYTL